MKEKFEGIILNFRKYNDRNNIVTAYSRQHGRLSFISPIGNGKGSAARRARLQPLSLISSEINFKPGVELQRLGSIALTEVWNDIYFHPLKRAESFFIAEFLYRLLAASQQDEPLWEFLVDSIRLFDRMKTKIADFHVIFLISLLPFTGIQPDVTSYKPGYIFDFASGAFVPEYEATGPVLRGEEAKDVIKVLRLNFSNFSRVKISSSQRRRLLNVLLSYYSYHFPGLSSLKSPEVLQSLFC